MTEQPASLKTLKTMLDRFLDQQQDLMAISNIKHPSHKELAWNKVRKTHPFTRKKDFYFVWDSMEKLLSADTQAEKEAQSSRALSILAKTVFKSSKDFEGIGKRDISDSRMRETALVFMIGEFEVLVNSLAQLMYAEFPEAIRANSEEKSYSRIDILNLESLEDFRDIVKDKDILNKMMNPFPDYLKMFNKCKMYGNGALPTLFEKGRIIEIFQRRNVLMHYGGKASRKYIDEIKVYKDELETNENYIFPEKDEVLIVDREYLLYAFDKISLMALHLCSYMVYTIYKEDEDSKVIWLGHLLNISMEFILDKKYNLAYDLCSMSIIQRVENTYLRNALFVNKMLATQGLNKQNELKQLVEGWSTRADEENRIFALARLIFSNQMEAAQALAEEMRKNEDINEIEWISWPLFEKLRELEKLK
jgi:hypothetical protein